MHHPTNRITHTLAFVRPVVEHWLVREITQWFHHEGSIRRPIAPRANALTTELHLAPSDSTDPRYASTGPHGPLSSRSSENYKLMFFMGSNIWLRKTAKHSAISASEQAITYCFLSVQLVSVYIHRTNRTVVREREREKCFI